MLSERCLTVIEGAALIADSHVQQVLGYGRINDLHRVIRKNEDELGSYGGVFCQTGKKPPAGSKGGRPTVAYFLTEERALLVCIFSRTPKAAEARRLIVEVFMRWRRSQLGGYGEGVGNTVALDQKRMHYAALPGKVQDIAAQRREAIEQVNAAIAEGARIGDAVAAAAEAMGVSCRTIRRFRDVTYMVADPDLEVALAPKWQHGPRGMMAECHPAARARYLELVGRGLRYATAFARVRQEADVHGWEPLPHPATMRIEAKRVFPQLSQSPKVKSIQ